MTGGYSMYPYFILYNAQTQYAEFIQDHPKPAFLEMQIRNYFKLKKPQVEIVAKNGVAADNKSRPKSDSAEEFKKRVTLINIIYSLIFMIKNTNR